MNEYMNPFTVFMLSVTGAAIGAYAGSYLREKGKNLATHEDIDRVVRATEDIKAQVSGELSVKQKRWDFKQHCYSELAENFGEQAAALQETRALLEERALLENAPGEVARLNKEAVTKQVWAKNEAVQTATQQIRRLGSKVRIAVAPEVRTLLSDVGDRWNSVDRALPHIDQVIIKRDIAYNAWIAIMEAARRDLFGEEDKS